MYQKSVKQSSYLLDLIESILVPLGFHIASPPDPEQRGSHISIKHAKAYLINRAMIEPVNNKTPSIIPDFRPPDLIRIGIAPLYNSFQDLYKAVSRIRDIVQSGEMDDRDFDHKTVS